MKTNHPRMYSIVPYLFCIIIIFCLSQGVCMWKKENALRAYIIQNECVYFTMYTVHCPPEHSHFNVFIL